MNVLKRVLMTAVLASATVAGVGPTTSGEARAAQPEVKTYTYVLEAYYEGRVVSMENFSTVAESRGQADGFAGAKLGVWGQSLNQKGIKWNRLAARFVSEG